MFDIDFTDFALTDFLDETIVAITGLLIGYILAIYRGARIFLHLKRNELLEDGEVLLVKSKGKTAFWVNAKTVIGAFFSLFLLLTFRSPQTSRHFLHKRTTMLVFSILVILGCIVLVSMSAYAAVYFNQAHKNGVNHPNHKAIETIPKNSSVKEKEHIIKHHFKNHIKPIDEKQTNDVADYNEEKPKHQEIDREERKQEGENDSKKDQKHEHDGKHDDGKHNDGKREEKIEKQIDIAQKKPKTLVDDVNNVLNNVISLSSLASLH